MARSTHLEIDGQRVKVSLELEQTLPELAALKSA